MVDSVGLYAGIKPITGAKEFSYFDYTPPQSMFEGIKNNNIRKPAPGYFTPIDKTPGEFNDLMFRSTLKQVLPIKGIPEAVTYGRTESDKNAYMYVHQGYARGQPLGLATDANKPMDLPIMPIAGFYDPDMLNVLGNLKG